MMRKLLFLFTIFLLNGWNLAAQNVTFKGSAPQTVAANQQFRITYTLSTSGESGKDIRIPSVKNLEELYGPATQTQMRTSNINGSVSTEVTNSYIYTYLAHEPGTYTISPATIKVGNSTYKSNEITIKVLPADQVAAANSANAQSQNRNSHSEAASADEVFMRMHVSKRNVYENEGFLVTFKLYSLYDVQGFESQQFPNFEGFIAQEIELPQNKQWTQENYNGKNYLTVVLKQSILYPVKSGKINISAGKYDIVVAKRSTNTRSFFDPFTYTNVKKTLTTAATTIDVKPLPAGKPASFTGAVGDYKMSSSITPTELKTNESVTVKVNISGSGNIKFVKNPEVIFPNDFDVYDPKVSESSKVNQSGVTGSKTIEYYGVPQYAGNFTIPKVTFSFFDPKSGTYKTLSSEEFQIQVEKGNGGNTGSPSPSIVNSINKEDIRYIGQDIRHIKTDGFSFHKGSPIFGTLNYWLSYLIPAFLFIILFIIFRKQAALNSNLALVRTKKANKVASKRLKVANKYLKENKQESFYDELLKAVWGYLSDKLNIPVSSLTKDNVEIELSQYGVEEATIQSFMDILNTAEFARFAPSQVHETMDELYNSTVQAIDKMENTIKNKG